MSTAKQTLYRGYSITTRWAEQMPSGSFRNTRRPASFDAAFTVHPPSPDEEDWQQFVVAVFSTAGAAEDNALVAAKRAIDQLQFTPSACVPVRPGR